LSIKKVRNWIWIKLIINRIIMEYTLGWTVVGFWPKIESADGCHNQTQTWLFFNMVLSVYGFRVRPVELFGLHGDERRKNTGGQGTVRVTFLFLAKELFGYIFLFLAGQLTTPTTCLSGGSPCTHARPLSWNPSKPKFLFLIANVDFYFCEEEKIL